MAPSLDITGLLSHLSISELREVLQDDVKADALVTSNDLVDQLKHQKREIQESAFSIAEYTAGREDVLKEMKDQLQQSHLALREKRREYDRLKEYSGSNGADGVENLFVLMQASSAATEQESEAMGQELTEGFKSVEEFVSQFVKKRTEAHVRRIKADKLAFHANGLHERGSHILTLYLPFV